MGVTLAVEAAEQKRQRVDNDVIKPIPGNNCGAAEKEILVE